MTIEQYTNKPISVFIPNYKRSRYLSLTLSTLISQNPQTDLYNIIVGNDTIDPEVDVISKEFSNVYSFTLDRNTGSRNGCFIRNYFIKRCNSDWIISKDPETLLIGVPNWLTNIATCPHDSYYRAKYVCMLCEEYTNRLLNGNIIDYRDIMWELIDMNKHFHIHHCLAVPTKILQDIHGYDERFVVYGPEDQDLWRRLNTLGLHQKELQVASAHLHHDRDALYYDYKHHDMIELFQSKSPNEIIANSEEWGNG